MSGALQRLTLTFVWVLARGHWFVRFKSSGCFFHAHFIISIEAQTITNIVSIFYASDTIAVLGIWDHSIGTCGTRHRSAVSSFETITGSVTVAVPMVSHRRCGNFQQSGVLTVDPK